MLRVITQNLNGIRSAARKGWLEWVAGQAAHVVCVQEVKAQLDDLDDCMRQIGRAHGHFHLAEKKGYSGVGLYSARKPRQLISGLRLRGVRRGGPLHRGRLRRLHGHLAVRAVRCELARAAAGEVPLHDRVQEAPEAAARRRPREIILCGDWNVAHKEIDLRNWRSNQKNSGFLPEERLWLTQIFDEIGFVDVFRRLDQRADQYTWWSNRGQAWGEERRLAARLPDRDASDRREGASCRDLQGRALLGPRGADHRLRGPGLRRPGRTRRRQPTCAARNASERARASVAEGRVVRRPVGRS